MEKRLFYLALMLSYEGRVINKGFNYVCNSRRMRIDKKYNT